MKIKPQALYSVKETANFLNLTERYLQMKAKKLGKQKIDNRYLYSGHEILEIASKRNEKSTEQKRTKNINKEVVRLVLDIKDDDSVIQILTSFKQGNKLEEFTPEEYEAFVERLTEANFLQQRIIEYKEEIKRMEEYVEDYRNTIEYLRTSLNKRGDEMQKLLDSVGTTLTSTTERNYIEAKEKNII